MGKTRRVIVTVHYATKRHTVYSDQPTPDKALDEWTALLESSAFVIAESLDSMPGQDGKNTGRTLVFSKLVSALEADYE